MTDVHALADDLGVLGMAEVERLGLGPRDLMRLVRAGRLVHLSRGRYAVPLSPAATPKVVHLQRLRAAERKYEGSAMGSHHSELLQLGLPAFGADLATVHLSRTRPRAQHRHSPGLMVHRPVPSEAILDTGRLHPALAIVQHGLTTSGVGALCAADAALRQRVVSEADLRMALAWVRQHPRSGLVRQFVRFADGRSESVGESRLRHACHLMGIAVTPQVTITDDGFVARVDFLVTGTTVVLEFDGAVKYADADGRDALIAEKWREDRLRQLGYIVVRVVWRELADIKALEWRIRQALARAA